MPEGPDRSGRREDLTVTRPLDHPLPPPVASASAGPLRAVGWDDAWAGTCADVLRDAKGADEPAAGAPPLVVGRLCRADLRAADVLVDARLAPDGVASVPGLVVVTAQWHPRLERRAAADPEALPAAGDWVVLRRAARERSTFQLETVLPRRTSVVRAEVGGTSHRQVLAANVDVAAVVEGLVPDLDLARVERLLALAWSSGARPLVVLTKADLVADVGPALAEVGTVAPGAEVVAVATTEGRGTEPLRRVLAEGATLAMLGASGVGKSTLVNALVAEPGDGGPMATRSLGAEGKGRHTTVTRELHPAPGGGAVLDTPGLRTVGLAAGTSVDDVFADVAGLAVSCRFRDCAHGTEPGCAVLEAVASGALTARRLASYRKLEREALWAAARTDHRLRAELDDRWKQVALAQRRSGKRR